MKFILTTTGTWLNVNRIITATPGRDPAPDGPRETLLLSYRDDTGHSNYARCRLDAPVLLLADVLQHASADEAKRTKKKGRK